MKFTNLKIGERFEKGCKTLCKVAVVGVLATSLVQPMTAYAAVEPYAIVGDQQYESNCDRQEIRDNDVSTIDDMFTNYVTLDDVSAAMEVSDAVNMQVDFDLNYANTNLNEVQNLQPTSLLRGLEKARRRGNEWYYCNDLHDELAAIDAYTMFGCKTVSQEMKNAIGNKVASIMSSYGMDVTRTEVVINWNEAYVLVSNRSSVVKVNLYGDYLDEVRSKVVALDDKYTRVTADMRGTDCSYENSFAYNGVDYRDGQSVWLSLGDDERKAMLRDGIQCVDQINSEECFTYDCYDYYAGNRLSYEEKQFLKDMGYTNRQLKGNKVVSLGMNKVMVYQYNPSY